MVDGGWKVKGDLRTTSKGELQGGKTDGDALARCSNRGFLDAAANRIECGKSVVKESSPVTDIERVF